VDHRWYTADEPWPDHAKPWWTQALHEARGAGWQLRTFSGHTWGKVVCDREATEPHQMLIFSTGRGGENAAKQLEKLIRRCHHKQSSPPDDDVVRASRLLEGASMLLDAAELLLSAADKRSQAEELLSMAEDAVARVEDSDAFLDAAAALDGESSEADMRATDLTASANYSPKRPQTTAAMTDEAERRVDQAEVVTSAHTVVEKARSLRERIKEIRARL
jgi:hypothetical protein